MRCEVAPLQRALEVHRSAVRSRSLHAESQPFGVRSHSLRREPTPFRVTTLRKCGHNPSSELLLVARKCHSPSERLSRDLGGFDGSHCGPLGVVTK